MQSSDNFKFIFAKPTCTNTSPSLFAVLLKTIPSVCIIGTQTFNPSWISLRATSLKFSIPFPDFTTFPILFTFSFNSFLNWLACLAFKCSSFKCLIISVASSLAESKISLASILASSIIFWCFWIKADWSCSSDFLSNSIWFKFFSVSIFCFSIANLSS